MSNQAIPVSHWSIMRIGGADHLVDVLPEDLLEREHSRIVDYDPHARVATTGSGRCYWLVDAPESSSETRHTFARWCQRHGLRADSAVDVSAQYAAGYPSTTSPLSDAQARAWLNDSEAVDTNRPLVLLAGDLDAQLTEALLRAERIIRIGDGIYAAARRSRRGARDLTPAGGFSALIRAVAARFGREIVPCPEAVACNEGRSSRIPIGHYNEMSGSPLKIELQWGDDGAVIEIVARGNRKPIDDLAEPRREIAEFMRGLTSAQKARAVRAGLGVFLNDDDQLCLARGVDDGWSLRYAEFRGGDGEDALAACFDAALADVLDSKAEQIVIERAKREETRQHQERIRALKGKLRWDRERGD